MTKRMLILIVLLVGLVAGCTNGDTEPTDLPTETEPSPDDPTEALTPVPTVAGDLPGEAICQADPLGLPVETRIPPVTEADHVHGNPNAAITVIEYADFQ